LKRKLNHISVGDHVLFAFQPQLGGFAALGFAASLQRSSQRMTSARMKPRSMSEWDLARGFCAVVPARMAGAALVFASVRSEIRSLSA